MKTSIIKNNGVRDSTENAVLKNWAVEYAKRLIEIEAKERKTADSTHKTATTLDHPNKSVKQQHIGDKAVGIGQIADGAIGTTQLAQGSVNNVKIADNAIDTRTIQDGTVTYPKFSEDIQTALEPLTIRNALYALPHYKASNSGWVLLQDTGNVSYLYYEDIIVPVYNYQTLLINDFKNDNLYQTNTEITKLNGSIYSHSRK